MSWWTWLLVFLAGGIWTVFCVLIGAAVVMGPIKKQKEAKTTNLKTYRRETN